MRKNITWIIFGLALLFLVFSQYLGFGRNSAILVLGLVLVISSFVIIKSADYLIQSISSYGKKTGFSQYLIGLFVLAIGTTLPDLSTGLIASLTNNGALILGDAFGANILDVTIVLGCIIWFSKKLKISDSIKRISLWVVVGALLPFLLGLDGVISRVDGFILLIVFIAYILFTLNGSPDIKKIKKDVPFKHIWKDMAVFLGALVALLMGTRWLVFSSVYIASSLNVPLYLVGLIFVAIGTTMPEILVAIDASKKNKPNLALADIMGAMSINSSLVIGFSAMINPIVIDNLGPFVQSGLFMMAAIVLGTILIRRKMNRKYAILLFALYGLFILISI